MSDIYLHHTRYTCRRCEFDVNGKGTPCANCGEPQRIPLRMADGDIRYLPIGMTMADFDDFLTRPWLRSAS